MLLYLPEFYLFIYFAYLFYIFIRYLSQICLSKNHQVFSENVLYIMIYRYDSFEFRLWFIDRNKVRLEEKVEKRLEENMIKSVKLFKRSAMYKLI